MAEEDLRNEVWKNSASQWADKFDELIDYYTGLYEHERPRHSTHEMAISAIPRKSKVK